MLYFYGLKYTVENKPEDLFESDAFGFFSNDKHMQLTYYAAFQCMPLASYRTQV